VTLLPKNPEKDPLLSPRAHLPCGLPPWGMLTAVDMVKGAIHWQVPIGSFDPLNAAVPQGPEPRRPDCHGRQARLHPGTWDPFIRAFDIGTGKELWKAQLPAAGQATPNDLPPWPQRQAVCCDRRR